MGLRVVRVVEVMWKWMEVRGVVFNMDGGLVERDVAGVNQGGFGNHGGDEVILVLNFNQDWFFFFRGKGNRF